MAVLSFSVHSIHQELKERLEKKNFQSSVRYFSAPQVFFSQSRQSKENLISFLRRFSYRERSMKQKLYKLYKGDFVRLSSEQCRKLLGAEAKAEAKAEAGAKAEAEAGLGKKELQNNLEPFTCLWVANRQESFYLWKKAPFILFFFTRESRYLKQVFVGSTESPSPSGELLEEGLSPSFLGTPWKRVKRVEIEPQLLAQSLGGELALQEHRPLGHMPTDCLNAVISIEDNHFLKHRGVHWKALFRATLSNFKALRWKQGGSTITQQMVKNYFLHPKKTLSRKFKEMVISFFLEYRMDKDSIMENYLNIIYLGQESTLSVKGFPAASRYYFDKDIQQTNLVECAQLAGMIYLPGKMNPFKYPQKAKERRNRVLQRMYELGYIGRQEMEASKEVELVLGKKSILKARFSSLKTAPYYIEMVKSYLAERDLNLDEQNHPLNIFTFFNTSFQRVAQESLKSHLEYLEKSSSLLSQMKEEEGQQLEAFMLVADTSTGELVSVLGGRDYAQSPFNRALKSRRSIGSTIKPFVYFNAMEQMKTQGYIPHPLQKLVDKPFTHSYEGKEWSPKNYGDKYYGSIPMFYALALSLNSATAQLGLKKGSDSLAQLVQLLRRLKVTSPLLASPSLTLGAVSMKPLELLQLYLALANMGSFTPIYPVLSVEKMKIKKGKNNLNREKDLLFVAPSEEKKQVLDSGLTALLISMLKQVFNIGTAKVFASKAREVHFAGKTGTTNDFRDAWFVGFSPHFLSLVWVGYDNNQSHGLSGSRAALPIWFRFMERAHAIDLREEKDFVWPESVENRKVPMEKVFLSLSDEAQEKLKESTSVELFFLKGSFPEALKALSE